VNISEFNEKFIDQGFVLKYHEHIGDVAYKSFKAMKDTVEEEYNFWRDYQTGFLGKVFGKYNSLKNMLDNIESLIMNENDDLDLIVIKLQQAVDQFNSDARFNLTMKHDITQKMKHLYEKDPRGADGFYKFYLRQPTSSNEPNDFFGALEAYNYLHSNTQTEKVRNYEANMNDVSKRYLAIVDEISDKYNQDTTKVELHYDELKEEIESWKNERISEVETFISEKKETMNEFEALYTEKLKLQSPAKYWEDLESDFRKEGKNWLIAAGVLSVLFIGLLMKLLYKLPATLNTTLENAGINTIRGTLILTIIISIGVYLIRLMVKMAMSSYHLSRDAKERHQLSYFYLALINDKAIDTEERLIVLQSLFSRSDTGLIKGDSSPAFPIDSMMAQIAKNITK
jgi:hypothetical protein